jgi:hypothetical protein
MENNTKTMKANIPFFIAIKIADSFWEQATYRTNGTKICDETAKIKDESFPL